MDIASNQYDIKSNDNLNPANAFNRKTGKYKILGGIHSIRKHFSTHARKQKKGCSIKTLFY